MTKLKLALAAAIAVSTIAVAVPEVASARPHHGHGYGASHHVRKVKVCRNVRIGHHWKKVCRWESRRW
ncbi:MAG: hypothetical protein JWP35_1653 [Caulobacter sp.]|jgi:hypothetical protein|nr:hypothetical protein [Caulobacter sp.]